MAEARLMGGALVFEFYNGTLRVSDSHLEFTPARGLKGVGSTTSLVPLAAVRSCTIKYGWPQYYFVIESDAESLTLAVRPEDFVARHLGLPSVDLKQRLSDLRDAILNPNQPAGSDVLELAGWVYTYGFGLPAKIGSTVAVQFEAARIVIVQSGRNFEVPFSAITHLGVEGAGKQSSDLGIIGGGFGLSGALQGILIADAINTFTRTYHNDCRLELTAVLVEGDGTKAPVEALFSHPRLQPRDLRTTLAPYMGAVRREQVNRAEAVGRAPEAPGATNERTDAASRLRSLKALRDEGLLTEAEYEAKRADLVRDL